MKHKTFQILKKAYMGDKDRSALVEAMQSETDPFTRYQLKLITGGDTFMIDWNIHPFTDQFRSGSPRKRLHETVFTFLLRIASIMREEIHTRYFTKPETFPVMMAWTQLFKSSLYCVLGLVYNIPWNPDQLFLMDECVLKLIHTGEVSALRELMNAIGIDVSCDLFPAENYFEKLGYMHVGQFSSFYWRLLHWMAEAYHLRKNMPHVKLMWRELMAGPLYRSLRCPYCITHFKKLIEQRREELLDESIHYPRLWFEIHNQVHANNRALNPLSKEADYLESDYELDSTYMRQALEEP